MRISTQQQYFKSIDQMQNSQSKLAGLQDQVSTGKKLQTPSDDPVAAAQVVKLERELSQYEKYDDNINVTERRLALEETILDDVNIALNRMRELTLNAANGTLQDQDRKSIANELGQLTGYVAGLMNTQDSQGEYLFSGSQGSTKPYVLENGRYAYQGDDGQRQIQVGSELFMPSNDSGAYLFESVDDRLNVTMTGQEAFDYESGVTTTEPFVSNVSFASTEDEASFNEAVKGLGDLTIAVTEDAPIPSGSYSYQISDSGGNEIVSSTSFTPGDSIDFNGMAFELNAPASATDNTLTFNVSTEKKNILDVAMDLAEGLNKPVSSQAERDELSELVATSLDQFKQASDRNSEVVATLGSRLSSLEFMSSSNLDFKLFTESAISSLVDADLASAISLFKLEEATLSAAQATFGRVSALSLFNYIN
ncbi:flagellar hook-associated protein FlgL [Neptunomonas qingdaonensis]|uniref:Flagellar hook-associated protein 3 FlgL n=1 Tax=Neptunomonas qingdaonensis TaxID=1045558 RepID=A0A1I2N176_9GAMM|nr:flagellar hook-associated protein FlgL [Neptunomonas qingdaonensis]SFF97512.1 flagellar hook-associated protein 3 FlgL [Neptunomonas qingdaonensis]